MTPFELTTSHIKPQPTVLYGLKFFPSLEPECSNDQDSPNWGWPVDALEVSDGNLNVVATVIKRLGTNCQAILEIGVDRNTDRSMSHVLMTHKPKNCKYLGVDIDNKRYLDNLSENIFTLQSNSHDKVTVRNRLRQLGVSNLDLILIDGWHSVHTCINDWGYTNMLSEHGAVILHDTNAHPGCIALFNAVDEQIFTKERFCTESNDMGISVFWHRK